MTQRQNFDVTSGTDWTGRSLPGVMLNLTPERLKKMPASKQLMLSCLCESPDVLSKLFDWAELQFGVGIQGLIQEKVKPKETKVPLFCESKIHVSFSLC